MHREQLGICEKEEGISSGLGGVRVMHFQQAAGASAAGWGSHVEWKVLEEAVQTELELEAKDLKEVG